MTDERRDTTPPEVERSKEAGETETEVERLQAEVARLTRERDAILAWAVKSSYRMRKSVYPNGKTWWFAQRNDGRWEYAETTAEDAVRKAAGLNLNGVAP